MEKENCDSNIRLHEKLCDNSYDDFKNDKKFNIYNKFLGIEEIFIKKDTESEFYLLRAYVDENENNLKRLKTDHDEALDRYGDIRPYSDNYISLEDGSYVNASVVTNPFPKAFIASQGPLSKTTEEFWRMIIENGVTFIIMLCNLYENGRSKCHNYWPQGKDKELEFGSISVKLVETIELYTDLYKTTLLVSSKDKKDITVNHLHFRGWPDHGVPEISKIYSDFMHIFKEIDANFAEETKNPVVVHCSAGVGRTGTLIALYNLYHQIKNQIKEEKEITLNIFNTVRRLKEQRCLLVENAKQYAFLYSFIKYHLKSLLK